MNVPTVTLSDECLEKLAALIVQKLQGRSLKDNEASNELLNTDQAAKLLGYANGKTFTKAVKLHRIPCRRINARKIMFDEAELMAWARGCPKIS